MWFSLKVLGLVAKVYSVYGIWYHYHPTECCQQSLPIRALMIEKAALKPPSPRQKRTLVICVLIYLYFSSDSYCWKYFSLLAN